MNMSNYIRTAVCAAALSTLSACDDEPAPVERGAELVAKGLCDDCHTPWVMGPEGPHPDMTRRLSGHPADMPMPPPPAAEGPWIAAIGATNTAWAGPWGVSFTANLTPDRATGLGEWSEDMFIAAFRTQRHMGQGRPILPPMPVAAIAHAYDDDDLRAIFAFLRSLPAIDNQVPQPVSAVAVL